MPHTLLEFKTALKGGGARPNLFQVDLTALPDGVAGDFDPGEFSFLCKAAALPASNIAPVDVPFRGRIFKVAGDRTFDTWTITVINDEDFRVRNMMERWMQFVGQYGDGSGTTNPLGYMRNANVVQLARRPSNIGNGDGNAIGQGLRIIANYKFESIFPTNISQIDLSYDTSDTIEEFTVEFQVQYWIPFGVDATGSSATV